MAFANYSNELLAGNFVVHIFPIKFSQAFIIRLDLNQVHREVQQVQQIVPINPYKAYLIYLKIFGTSRAIPLITFHTNFMRA